MGKKCSFTGHRCDLLYGYNIEIKEYKILAKIIANICKKLIIEEGVDEFYTGGALGFDTVAFWAIEYLKKEFPHIKNILCIPYDGHHKKWISKIDLDRLCRMKKLADDVVYVDKEEGYLTINGSSNDKLQKRNEYLVDKGEFLISCWNGVESRGTYKCISYAKKKNRKIININPKIVYKYI